MNIENKRKGKTMLKLWLDETEYLSLKESIELITDEFSDSKQLGYGMSNISEIIQNAYERGDLVK